MLIFFFIYLEIFTQLIVDKLMLVDVIFQFFITVQITKSKYLLFYLLFLLVIEAKHEAKFMRKSFK